jgi:hypothetical protein
VIGHYYERVKVKAFLGSLLLKNLNEQDATGIDLEESSAGGGYSGDEVSADFLRR